ncbi:MAG: adenylosuccinate synthase [Phycisphaerae bacterium]|nr:adenylosuccinate synthase [Phycisphaerae bacterium]
MTATAVIGANWGDEGKGKITDYLSGKADFVVRFQGGNNAGHTVINDYGKFALHLLPSGVFYPNVVNILGPGVAVNISAFLSERDELISRGVPEPKLMISDRAQVVMPYHIRFDEYEERRLGDRKFGSTKVGIAPFYADKYLKLGIQVADLFEEDRLRSRLEASLAAKNILLKYLYGRPVLSTKELLPELLKEGKQIRPFVRDVTEVLHTALKDEKRILLEGQLGALRDPDHGVYPYPTSSSPLAGFASVGAGVPTWSIRRIVAVVKAYSSCVGAGPFVTELFDEAANELRRRGGDAGEYGATTGRPRRVGWLDMVATRYGCRVQGATEIALTNLDVLSYLDEIPICKAYWINGKDTDTFPVSALLDRAKPVWEKMPGWKGDISRIRRFDDLPLAARRYVKRIEELIDLPVRLISVGPKRDAIMVRDCFI